MYDFLQPVSASLVAFAENLPIHTIGKSAYLHTLNERPFFGNEDLVLFSVSENRNNVEVREQAINFEGIRRELYQLAKGNWGFGMVDIGHVEAGDEVQDTYFAVTEICKKIREKNAIPVILGGGQDIAIAQYKSYAPANGMVNIVNVDAGFDLGNVDFPISNKSFLGKIVVDQPYNLFNYTNLGYQSYFVAPEELDLMDRMYFDAHRLGAVVADLSIAEPVFRDADVAIIDLNALSAPFYGSQPNGFSGREICTLARYAGISDKVSNFGIYEYESHKSNVITNALVAQMIWYFAEGVGCRWHEPTNLEKMDVIHYQVPIDGDVFSFYKSKLTGRWWINIRYSDNSDNNLQNDALLPCTYQDYEQACNQVVPERWYNAKIKFEM